MPGSDPRPPTESKSYQIYTMIKYSISTYQLLLSSTCFGGFAAENVPGTTGILFTFFRSRCTQLRITSSEISSFEYLDGSVVPWYWNPSDSRACNGWILRFIQSNMTVSPVNILCLKMESARVVQRFDSPRLVFYSTRTIWLEGRE